MWAGLPFSVLTLSVVSCNVNKPARNGEPALKVPRLETFVLPKGYRGPFVAVYSQHDGQRPRWKGDTAVFSVGVTGVIRIPYPEPPASSRTSHVFADRPSHALRNYPTCADMRVDSKDALIAVCWLDFRVSLQNSPEHIVAVVTDWAGIPDNFERTTLVYDSVVFSGKGIGLRKWEEPPALKRSRADRISARVYPDF